MKFFIITLCCSLVWAGGSSAWPQFQHDSKNSSFTSIVLPSNPELIWTKDLTTSISPFTSPIIGWANGEEVVYIGTGEGLYCVSSSSGDVVWFYPTSLPVIYTPAYESDRLYFGAGDTLYCLNAQSGELIHKVGLGSPLNGHLTISSDHLYLVAGKRLFAFNGLNCELLWQTSDLGTGFDNQAPAVDDSYIYVVTLGNTLAWYDYRIYKFNSDGQQIWMKEELYFEPGGCRMSPTVAPNGDIYFGLVYSPGWTSSLYCYKPNGDLYWRKTDDDGIAYSSPAVSGNNSMIIFGAYGNNGNFIRKCDTSGNLSWSYATDIRYSSPAIDGNNRIIFGTTDGWFKIVDDGGNLCYQYNCGGSLTSAAIAWDQFQGAIYIASDNGKVYKFGSSDVGVEERNISTINQIKCFPNPFKNVLNVSLERRETVRIFDIAGREIFSETGQRISWQAQTVPAGVYFVQIGDRQEQIKVVKLK